MTIIQIICGK